MLNKKGKTELSYNAQLVVDKNGIIIADDVVQNSSDKPYLAHDIDQVEQNFGKLSEGTKVLADAGYENGEQMQILNQRGFDLYIPGKFTATIETRQKEFSKAKFKYNEQKDTYICPENKILNNIGQYYRKKEQRHMTIYKCQDCATCPQQKACCKNKKLRTLHAIPEDKLLNKIKEKLQTIDGEKIYKLRKQTIERSIGDIKHNKKFTTFLTRGIEKVKTEFNIACIAHNLVIINNLMKKKNTKNPSFLANTC